MYKLMIVEDDPGIARSVRELAESWGYIAQVSEDFRHITAAFTAFQPHLVLMDVKLPFFNGYHWCSEIRKVSQVPIIFLSSAADNMNIVMAMNMGGDDFIAKPFDLNVLTAKLQALLRRTYDFHGQNDLLVHRGAALDLSSATLSYQGEMLELTRNEYKILRLLMENKGRTVSRETIMLRLWESDSYIDENTLTVNINRLRRKLEAAGLRDFIRTKKGMGYLVE